VELLNWKVKPGSGSKFTLYLPINNTQQQEGNNQFKQVVKENTAVHEKKKITYTPSRFTDAQDVAFMNEVANETGDDRHLIQAGDKVVMVVEDDLRFAKIMVEKATNLI
jgi:beta-lactam-binding protein with PASTA domain